MVSPRPSKPTPKATSKPKEKPSIADQMIVEGFKRLSPSQQDQIAKFFGWQRKPSPKPQPRGTYNPKEWEGVIGDKGW